MICGTVDASSAMFQGQGTASERSLALLSSTPTTATARWERKKDGMHQSISLVVCVNCTSLPLGLGPGPGMYGEHVGVFLIACVITRQTPPFPAQSSFVSKPTIPKISRICSIRGKQAHACLFKLVCADMPQDQPIPIHIMTISRCRHGEFD